MIYFLSNNYRITIFLISPLISSSSTILIEGKKSTNVYLSHVYPTPNQNSHGFYCKTMKGLSYSQVEGLR